MISFANGSILLFSKLITTLRHSMITIRSKLLPIKENIELLYCSLVTLKHLIKAGNTAKAKSIAPSLKQLHAWYIKSHKLIVVY